MPVVTTRRSRTFRALALGVATLIASALFATGIGAGAASATVPMSLTIHLTSSTGKTVSGAEVDVYQLDNGAVSDDYDTGMSTAYPVAKKAGTYLDDELNGAGQYVIELGGTTASGTAEQWLGGSLTQDGAKVLTLTAGANTISASYAASGTISGKVTNSAGKALRNICVSVDVFDGQNWAPQDNFDCDGYTNSSGKYSFSPGAAGSYKVEFSDIDTGAYLSKFANGATDDADAAPLYLGAGKSAVVNASLTLGGTLRGTLVETKVPSTPAELVLIPYLLSGPTGAPTSATPMFGDGYNDGFGATTNSHGAFSISGLSTGNYALGYIDYAEYEAESGDGMPTVHFLGANGGGVLHATSFAVTASHTTVVPTTAVGSPVMATGSLAVTLEDSNSAVIRNESQEIQVYSEDSFLPYSASGDTSQGVYDYDSLPAGGYDVYVEIMGDDGDLYQPQVAHVSVGAGETDQTIQMHALTKFAYTTPPSTGTIGAVGSDVVADPGVVNLTSDDSTVSYQWYDVDSGGNRTLIRGAQSQHFTARGADLGRQIEARVIHTYNLDIAGMPMYSESVSRFTNLDSISESSSFVNNSVPTIASSGGVKVGVEVDANPGTWTPSGSSYTYAWYLDDSDTPIVGATHASFTPVATDQGHQLSVRVQPHQAGYGSPLAVPSAPVEVGLGDAATVKKVPVVSKKTKAGATTYTVTPGTWSIPSAGLKFQYQWTVNGAIPLGAKDSATFSPASPGVIAVTVKATRLGYANGTKTVIAAKGTLPVITAGVAQVGGTGVTPSTREPVGQQVAYAFENSATLPDGSAIHPVVQWQRQTGSKWANISHQTGQNYSYSAADVGHHVRVRLTIATSQWATKVVYANAGIGELGDLLDGVGAVSIPLMRTFGGSLTATVSGFLPGVKHTYQWQRSADGVTWTPIPKATKSTLTLAAPVAVGDDVRVVVTSTMTGSLPATLQSPLAIVLDKTVRLTAFPTITPAGGVKVGSVATAVGAAADVPGVSWTYQWAYDGSPISGGTAKTYKPLSSQIDHLLTVTVVGHKTGYIDSDKAVPGPAPATSAPELVLDPAHDPLDPAAITLAAPKFGVVEHAPVTTDVFHFRVGFTAYTTAYQWKLDGKSISHATAATYSPKTTDVGHKLSLTMSIKSDVYGSASQTSAAQKVQLGDAGAITANVIGNSTPGNKIGVALGYSGEGQLTYLWQISANGTTWAAIPKATHNVYLIQLRDAGKQVRVIVTSKVAGRANATVTTDPFGIGYTGVIASRIAPTLGTTRVGVADAVNTGSWNTTGLAFTYQWFLDDVAIPGGTSASFTPLGSDLGSDLSVRVTASRAGYETDSETSDSEEITLGAAPVIATKPIITGTAATCKVLSVSTGSWNLPGLTVGYLWLSNGVSTGDTGTTYTTVAGDATKQISVRVTASAIGRAPGSYETAKTKAVVASVGC
jgi:hypothetical protein